jgi:hypothetical protein
MYDRGHMGIKWGSNGDQMGIKWGSDGRRMGARWGSGGVQVGVWWESHGESWGSDRCSGEGESERQCTDPCHSLELVGHVVEVEAREAADAVQARHRHHQQQLQHTPPRDALGVGFVHQHLRRVHDVLTGDHSLSAVHALGTDGWCSPRHQTHFEPGCLTSMACYDVASIFHQSPI